MLNAGSLANINPGWSLDVGVIGAPSSRIRPDELSSYLLTLYRDIIALLVVTNIFYSFDNLTLIYCCLIA